MLDRLPVHCLVEKICKKPIAGYDNEKKQAYVEYANGKRKYVNIENL